jgi:hypothetical protein
MIQVCSNKGPGPLQRGIITEMVEKGMNYEARKLDFK